MIRLYHGSNIAIEEIDLQKTRPYKFRKRILPYFYERTGTEDGSESVQDL